MKIPMLSIFAFLALIIISGCSSKIGEMKFTQLYSEKMTELNGKIVINEIKRLEIKYSLPEMKEPADAFLDNAYKNYLNGEDLSETISKFASATIEGLTYEPVDIKKIVPVVKDNNYLLEVRESIKKAGKDPSKIEFFSVPLCDGLSVLYAVDSEKNIRYINGTDFKHLNIDEPKLRKIATENLKNLLPKIETEGKDGVYFLTADGNYDSSILLFDDIWKDMKPKVDGNIVVAVPARDLLMVTGSNNSAAIRLFKQKALEIVAKSSYSLTADLFEYSNSTWRRLKN